MGSENLSRSVHFDLLILAGTQLHRLSSLRLDSTYPTIGSVTKAEGIRLGTRSLLKEEVHSEIAWPRRLHGEPGTLCRSEVP